MYKLINKTYNKKQLYKSISVINTGAECFFYAKVRITEGSNVEYEELFNRLRHVINFSTRKTTNQL